MTRSLLPSATLTVGQLRDLLARHPDDAPVLLAAPSGDYWGTVLALPVRHAQSQDVHFREYSGTYAVPRDDRDPDPDEPARVNVVLLTGP